MAVPESQSMQAFHPRVNPPKKRKLGVPPSRVLDFNQKGANVAELEKSYTQKGLQKAQLVCLSGPN